MRRARSRASQAMSLECTWWAASPRTSQMPASGSLPSAGDQVGEAAHRPPGLGVEAVAGLGEQPGGVEDPAVAVELVLVGGAVADPDRHAVGVAGPARQLALRRWVPAVQGEQDRQAGPVEAAGVEQPGQEAARLVVLADAEEGGDADAGVAGPGVAVVPVPDARRGPRAARWSARRPAPPRASRSAAAGSAGCAPPRRGTGRSSGRSSRTRPATGPRRPRARPTPRRGRRR